MTASANIKFFIAGPEHEADLRRLLRESPMPGPISLSLEREPDFFLSSSIEGDAHCTVAAIDLTIDRIVGFGSRSIRDAYVNGEVVRLGYLSQLRVAETHRRRIKGLLHGYTYLGNLRGEDELPFDITTIMSGNDTARRLLTRGMRGVISYHERDSIDALTIPVRQLERNAKNEAVPVATAISGDLDGIADCLQRNYRGRQFAPVWRAEDLNSLERTRGLNPEDFFFVSSGGSVVGCAAIWDQRSFKQVVVRGYADELEAHFRSLRLPEAGGQLQLCHASHIAVDGDDPVVFRSLLERLCEACLQKEADYLTLGLCARSPLRGAVSGDYRALVTTSALYTASWHGEASGHPIDERLAHLEIATL